MPIFKYPTVNSCFCRKYVILLPGNQFYKKIAYSNEIMNIIEMYQSRNISIIALNVFGDLKT
jgi:hypothetical protein